MSVVRPTLQLRLMDSDFRDTLKADFPKSIMMPHTIDERHAYQLLLVAFEKASTSYKFFKLSFIPMCEIDFQIAS